MGWLISLVQPTASRFAPDLDCELWRFRLGRWRVVYAITEEDQIMDVLAVRKRPPYDYGDLDELLADMPGS